jgi:hypothetical protein
MDRAMNRIKEYFINILTQNVWLVTSQRFTSKLHINNINHEIAQYINNKYEIKAVGSSYSLEEEDNLFKARASTTNHGNNIFIEVEHDRDIYFEDSFYMAARNLEYNYKEEVIRQIVVANNLLTYDNIVLSMFGEDAVLEKFDLQEAYERYVIKELGEDYIEQLFDEEFWIVEEKDLEYDDYDWENCYIA